MPLVVRKTIPNTTTIPRKWTTVANSDQQWDQALRIQMGIHAKCRRTSNRHTILCVWRTSTNSFSIKTRRTRFCPNIQWRTTKDYTSKRLQYNIDQGSKPILSKDNSHSNTSKLPTTNTAHSRRNNSNDSTNNIDTTGSRTNPRRKQWFLDVQQWRIPGTSSQDKKEGIIPSVKDVPNSSWQTGEL